MSTNSKKSTVDLYKIIAQNIRKLIEAMEWNQKKFADATGISEPALSNYMKNLKESENSPKKDEEDSDKKNNDNKRLPSVDYLYNLTRTQAFHDAGIVFTIDEFLSESFNPVTSEKRKRTISRTNTVGQTFTGNYICYLFDQSKPINEFDFKHARELRYGVITVYGTFTANGIYENRVVARFFKKEEYTDAIRLKKDLDEIFIKNKDDMQAVQSDPFKISALHIKAADRIHNLRTIDEMSSTKKHKKTDETEINYLPLFKKFNLNYFVDIIEDLVWRTNNVNLYDTINDSYNTLFDYSIDNINSIKDTVISCLNNEFKKLCTDNAVKGFKFDVNVRKYPPLEIKKFLDNSTNSIYFDERNIDKANMPLCDIDIIMHPLDIHSTTDLFTTFFVKAYSMGFSKKELTITDMFIDDYRRVIVYIEDKNRNTVRFCFCMREDYIVYINGSKNGSVDYLTDTIIPKENRISVKLRNGSIKFMPVGSTVLDLAFSIHEEVGLSAKTSIINGNPAELYSILHEGDKVEVISDSEEFTPHARIGWLKHITTKNARDILIRYLERRYEDDNHKNTFKAKNNTIDNLLDELCQLTEIVDMINNDKE